MPHSTALFGVGWGHIASSVPYQLVQHAGDAIHPVLQKCEVLTIHGTNIDGLHFSASLNRCCYCVAGNLQGKKTFADWYVGREIWQRKLLQNVKLIAQMDVAYLNFHGWP